MQRHWMPRGRGHMNHAPEYNRFQRPMFNPNVNQNDRNFCHYRPPMPQPPPHHSPWYNQQRGSSHPTAPFGRGFNNFVPDAHIFQSNEEQDHTVHGSKHNQRGRGRGNSRGAGNRKPHNEQCGPNQKKNKDSKKERNPSECPFYCKACDKGYMTEDNYKEHCSSHIQCTGDGCSYVAAAKLVKLHYEMQHKTGLAKKIWKLESKEDIEKWRQERRRNFPTQENMERKQRELAERRARGEVMVTQEFGKMKGRQNRNRKRGGGDDVDAGDADEGCHVNKRKRRRRQRRQQLSTEEADGYVVSVLQADRASPTDTEMSAHKDQTQHSPVESPEAPVTVQDADVECEPPTTAQTSAIEDATPGNQDTTAGGVTFSPAPGEVGALQALASLYGDMSSDEEETDNIATGSNTAGETTSVQHSSERKDGDGQKTSAESNQPSTLSVNQPPAMSVTQSSTQSVPESEAQSPLAVKVEDTKAQDPERVKNTKTQSGEGPRGRKDQGRKKGGPNRPMVPKKQLTLLQRLLAPDIRRERNIVLQCVRHVVNNDFFGVSSVHNTENLSDVGGKQGSKVCEMGQRVDSGEKNEYVA